MKEQEPNGKAYQKVIDYIKGNILRGDYRLGQRIPPERELAELLDVSRNSVREAIRTLDIMGVLSSQQGAGNYVSSNFEKNLVESMALMFVLHRMDYRQLGELRSGLGQKAMELAVRRCSAAQLQLMKQTVSEMRYCQDEIANASLDKKFHLLIAQASQNQLILDITRALSDVMDLFIRDVRQAIPASTEAGRNLQECHERMVESIEQKNQEGASQAMADHFVLIEKYLEGAVQKRSK